jgi:hypothetical protein
LACLLSEGEERSPGTLGKKEQPKGGLESMTEQERLKERDREIEERQKRVGSFYVSESSKQWRGGLFDAAIAASLH